MCIVRVLLVGICLIISVLTETNETPLPEVCVKNFCYTVLPPKATSRDQARDICGGKLAVFPPDMTPADTYDFPRLYTHFSGPLDQWV